MIPTPVLDKIEGINPFATINTSPLEIGKILRSLKKSHFSACGIPAKLLVEIATPISHPLFSLYNNLFSIGHYPDIWKISYITPVYKRSGLKSEKSNYRPISLLPTLSKVCESVMHQRLLAHCKDFNIISSSLGDSTISQLLYIVHSIRLSWSQNKMSQGIFLDISAAFDTVWHAGLLSKLMQIGIEEEVLDLF